jgi:hypothetical protein
LGIDQHLQAVECQHQQKQIMRILLGCELKEREGEKLKHGWLKIELSICNTTLPNISSVLFLIDSHLHYLDE